LATITNIIQTIFTSQGANNASRDLNTLGRAQTRLGQSSASAGRSFAAQSAGLGGLVAAYAGAAATTFALQQGFDKLAKSARAMQTIEGLSSLAGSIAQDGNAILKSVQQITNSQMTLVESASQINLALSAGFNTKQIEGLSEVAIKASRALGRDLTDAMTRVTRGSAKMETELLDELGIYTKIEPATRAYAAALGRSVTSLSEFERRQAFANAVIAEGQRKFASINTTIPTSAEKIEAFGAKIIDLGTQLGGLLADFVAPLADFMTNNLTASFAAFGLVVSLIASKAIQVFLGAIAALRESMLASSRAVENFIRIKLGLAEAARVATAAVAGLNTATLRGTQAEKNQLAGLQETAKARALTRGELQQSEKLIGNNITALNAERDAFRQNIREAAIARGKLDQAKNMARGARPGDFSDPAEQARNAAIRAANRAIAETRPAALAAVAALPALRAQLTQLQTAYAATGAAASGARAQIAAFAGAALAFVGRVGSNFAAGIGSVLGLVSKIFFFITIIQLAGSAIANFLGYGDDFNAFFIGVGKSIQKYFGIEQSKKIQSVINGITVGTLENLEKTNQELRELESFKFTERKFLGIEFQVEKTKEQLVKEADSILTTVSTGVSDGIVDGILTGAGIGAGLGAFFGPVGVAIGAGIGAGLGYFLDSSSNEIEEATNKYGETIKNRLSSQLEGFSAEAAENAVQALSILEERMGKQAMFDPQARAAKDFLETLILQSAQYSDQLDTISKIVSATGKQSNQVVDQFDFKTVSAQLDYIDEAILKINNIELRLRIANEDSTALEDFFSSIDYEITNVKPLAEVLNIDSKTINSGVIEYASEQLQILRSALEEVGKPISLTDFISEAQANGISDRAVRIAESLVKTGKTYKDFENAVNTANAPLQLGDIFRNTVLQTNELNSSLLRSGSVLADTFKGIQDGNLDLEKFGQNFTNISNSVILSTRALPKAQEELNKFSSIVQGLDLSTQDAAVLTQLIADEQARIDAAKLNVETQKELLSVLKEQEKTLKQQVQFNEFIKNITPKSQNPFEAALTLSKAGGKNEITSTVEFLKTSLSDTAMNAKTEFESLRTTLRGIAPELSTDEISTALSTSAGNAKTLAVSLRDAGVNVRALDDNTLSFVETFENAKGGITTTTTTVNLLEAATMSLGDRASKTVEALQGIASQTVSEAIVLLNTEKATAVEREKVVNLANLELSLKRLIVAESANQLNAEIALGKAREAADRSSESLELLKLEQELVSSRAALEEQASNNRIAGIERELTAVQELSQERVSSLEKEAALANKRSSILLKISEVQVPEANNPLSIEAEAISLRAEQARTQFTLESRISEVKRITAEKEYSLNLQILRERESQAERDYQQANANISAQAKLVTAQYELARQQEQIELDSIREQIRQSGAKLFGENAILDREAQLARDRINQEIDLESKKATAQYDDLIARLNLFQAQEDANSIYFKAWEQVLTELKGTSVTVAYGDDSGNFDVNTLISDLEDARQSTAATFEDQRTAALALAEEESNLIRNRTVAELASSQTKLNALETFYAARAQLERQANNITVKQAAAVAQGAKTAWQAASDAVSQLIAKGPEAAQTAEESMINIADSIIDIYSKVVDVMSSKIQEYRGIVEQVAADIKRLDAEELSAELKFKVDLEGLKSDLAMAQEQFKLESLQTDVRLIEAKESSGSLTAIQAAEQVNAKQQEILTQQIAIEELRYYRETEKLANELALLVDQAELDKNMIDAQAQLQADKIAADLVNVQNLIDKSRAEVKALNDENAKYITAVNTENNNFMLALAKTLYSGAASIGEAAASLGAKVPDVIAGVIDQTTIAGISDAFSGVSDQFVTSAGEALTSIYDGAERSKEQIDSNLDRELTLGTERMNGITAEHEHKVALLGKEGQIETEQAAARMKSAKAAGNKEKEKLDELQDKFNEAIGKLKDAFVSLIKDVVETIGSMVTKGLERKVEMAKVNETIANTNLAATSEKLSEAQSKQQDLMQKEISLRDEIQESYKTLAETQKTYIDSLTGDDRSIKQSSRVLIDNILDQKRKQIDLSKTINERIRQDTFVQTLEYRKLSQEQQLEEATIIRVAAEEKLAETQALITQITSLLSGEMFKLANSLQALQQAAGGVNETIGMGAKSGFGMQDLAGGLEGFGNKLVNQLIFGGTGGGNMFSNAVTSLTNAAKSLFGAGSNISKAVGASGSVKSLAPLTSQRPMANPFYGAGAKAGAAGAGFFKTVGSAIGGAFQGFGVGQLVGALTKDPGMGSSIGGAIGGAISTIFASKLVTAPIIGALSSGIGAAIGMAATFVVPVLGAIAGALIGRLFSKTPTASATGQLTSEGFAMTSSYERKVAGGTAKNLSDIAGSTLGGVVDSLKAVGVQFKDVVSTSIGLRKNSITGASLEFAGGARFEKGGSGTSQEDIQGIAQFYLDSFVKGLRTGSLVVEKTVRGAADLQSAIDKFVKEDQGTKTIERLKEVLDYAAGFSDMLDKLGEAVPVTMGDALNQVVEGARAAANAAAAQYSDLKAKAVDVFGTASAQYDTLNKKLKANALAQLGLAKGSDGIIRSVSKANEELNAGTLAIVNIVESIGAFDVALVAAGFAASEAANIIDIALNTQLTDFIGAIGENLKNSIDILKNPAVQSAIELEAIIANAAERNKQAEGVLAGLRSSERRISESNIDKAIDNVAKSLELGALEVEKYLESLNIEQLKAVVADEARIDAATRLAASSRLVAIEDQDRATAAKQFVKVSREFNKGLAEITKSSAVPQFVQQATSVIEIAQLLGRNSIDQFSIDFASLINAIGRGENISSNFETAIAGLNGQLSAGTITYTELVGALDLLQSTALDSIQVLADLVSSVEETTSQIYDLYSTSLDSLLTSTEEVGSSFNDLLDGFKDKTQSVLGLFDDTLKSVAESGNKLYTLRDNAKEAFDTAAKAVSEFEKANKLTGRTVTQVTTELASVSSQIASLSSKPFDFAAFLNLGSLSSKQRLLQAELSKLTTVQEEYGKLIADRTKAEQDSLFAAKTVTDLEASANSKLLDTRIKESETVQEVKNAALEFVTSQKDLQDITQLLTAANFNLNQARFEERDRVVQVSEALRDLTIIAGNLVAEATSINATDVNKVQAQAKLAAEIAYGTSATTQITAAVNQAVAEFNSLKAVASSVTSVVNTTVGVGTTFANAVKSTSDTLKIYDSLLTDSFVGYTKTISGYVTNINAILKTSFDNTDTTNFTGFITNLNKTQDALQLLSPTLNQLLADSKLGVIAGVTQSIGESVGTFQNNIITAVNGLLDAFSPARKSKVDEFRTALDNFDKIGTTINATGGLKDALANSSANANSLTTNLTTLVSNFSSLSTEVAKLNDTTNATTKVVTPGSLSQARAKITELATALQTAWNSVQFQVNTNLGTGITVNANVNAGSALTTNDRGNLKSIATNSGRFPAITALGTAGYTAGTMPGAAAAFAEGGYVQGTGSGTSDSIPAKLSNGEYVIKASTVSRLGKNLLDDINSTGSIGLSLSKMGRRGDSLVAHINPKEARMLRENGGSGTYNPNTGLLEFFNNDGGAYGGLFETQEIDKLVNSFTNMPSTIEQTNGVSGFARMDGTLPANADSTGKIYPWNPGASKNLALFDYANLIKLMSAATTISSRPAEARGFGGITGLSYGIADPDQYMNNNNIVMRSNGGAILSHDPTNGAPVGVGPEGYGNNRNKYNGGLAARLNQTVRLANHMYGTLPISASVDSTGISRAVISDYVKSLNNRQKMFFDFYMLKSGSANNRTAPFTGISTINTLLKDERYSENFLGGDQFGSFSGTYGEAAPARPVVDTSNPFSNSSLTAGNYSVRYGSQMLSQDQIRQRFFSAGGLVTSPRDSVSAMLEPGEFVLRKQAVDRMGLDSAIRLNSTGDVGGDIEVEVNINNNGTSQTTTGTPEVRRENGKIVVDIILEDLRTNGPINRQIRSIR
jgi:hypothetical protein